MSLVLALAALSGAVAVGAGAFGAHAAQGEAAEWLRTGGLYQLIHAVAAAALAERSGVAAWLFVIGGAVFALSLYAMALGAPRWFGAITPIGGTLLIVGWLWLAWVALRG